jgi:retron-type reverse transcriptase
MKRHGNLYALICSFENLLKAAEKAQKGKRFKASTAFFNLELEYELLALRRELTRFMYRPGPYTTFRIRDPKPRLISAAPYRDRVVHHALCNVIEPIFDRTFIYDSYACRKGKGTHAALNRFTQFARQFPYVLRLDVKKYFPSIDHIILKRLIKKKIKDPEAIWLIELIIDSSNPQEWVCDYFPGDDLLTPLDRRRGIPIGNLTSQFFANIYLNTLDHFVKEELGVGGYVRYVDDMALFDCDKVRLWEYRERVSERIEKLRLKLHPWKCHVLPTARGVNFLGFRIYPDHRRLLGTSVRRAAKRLERLQREYAVGKLSWTDVNRSVQSWLGHVGHGDTYGLRRYLLCSCVFTRGWAP